MFNKKTKTNYRLKRKAKRGSFKKIVLLGFFSYLLITLSPLVALCPHSPGNKFLESENRIGLVVKSQAADEVLEEFYDPKVSDKLINAGPGSSWIRGIQDAITKLQNYNPVTTVIKAILEYLFRALLYVFYSITYALVNASQSILGIIFNPDFIQKMGGFTTASFVKGVAQEVAKFCNMAYIFVLLFIAIMAIFGIGDTKRWLVKLVVVALLTNFALVISGVIIDFSQVIMHTVYKSGVEFKMGTNILDNLESYIWQSEYEKFSPVKLEDQAVLGAQQVLSKTEDESFWNATTIFFFKAELKAVLARILHVIELIIFALALTVTLVSVTVILLVRIIAVWILLILSPVAFLLYAIPNTEKYFREWFENLTKYAFTGPIIIFFLWLANKIASVLQEQNKIGDYSGLVGSTSTLREDFYAFIVKNFQTSFQFFVLIIIIWAGIIIANKFGIKGAPSADKLIKWSRRLGLGALATTGFAFKQGKMSAWSLSKFRERYRNRKLERMGAEAGALQAAGKMRAASDKRDAIKALEEKMIKTKKTRDIWMKTFAFASPTFLKQKFSSFLKQRGEEYQGDLGNALSGFTNVLLNKGQKQKVAAINSREALFDFQTAIKERVAKWRDPNTSPTERIAIANEIKEVIKGIAEKTTNDTPTQNRIRNGLENEVFLNPALNMVKGGGALPIPMIRTLLSRTSQNINVDIFREAARLAQEETLDYLKEEKNREEEAKKQKEFAEKIREQEKEGKFNPEFAMRQVIRASVSKIEQKALSEHLATSSRNFGKFVESINKEIGNLANPNDVGAAMGFIKDRLSENEMLNILRIAEKDAEKSNNLSQIGWMTFDQILNKSRETNPTERENIIKKVISGWSITKKITKVNPIVFDINQNGTLKDPGSVKVLFDSIDFNYLMRNPRIIADIKEDVSDKTRGLLKNNINTYRPFVKPAEIASYNHFINNQL